jgi:hypothetical protein
MSQARNTRLSIKVIYDCDAKPDAGYCALAHQIASPTLSPWLEQTLIGTSEIQLICNIGNHRMQAANFPVGSFCISTLSCY